MNKISIKVNGQPIEAYVEPRLLLADFLRAHAGAKSVHLGCEHGVCGACTILIDGVTARACIALAVDCDGAEIVTLEGLEEDALTDTLRDCFHTEHGLQCGYCTPGMLLTARDLILREENLDQAQVRHALSANICRCTGYAGIVRAVTKAAGAARAQKGA